MTHQRGDQRHGPIHSAPPRVALITAGDLPVWHKSLQSSQLPAPLGAGPYSSVMQVLIKLVRTLKECLDQTTPLAPCKQHALAVRVKLDCPADTYAALLKAAPFTCARTARVMRIHSARPRANTREML